jgi:hypothetical protein
MLLKYLSNNSMHDQLSSKYLFSCNPDVAFTQTASKPLRIVEAPFSVHPAEHIRQYSFLISELHKLQHIGMSLSRSPDI